MKEISSAIRTTCKILIFSAALGFGYSAKALDYYVDGARGNDSWTGTAADARSGGVGPFATLERARDAVRSIKQQGTYPANGVTIWLRAGTYERTYSFALTSQDSGVEGGPVVYRAYGNEDVRIIGGHKIGGFQKVTNSTLLSRLASAARNNVYQVDLRTQGVTDFGSLQRRGYRWQLPPRPAALELFFLQKPMTLARWPNDGFTKVSSVISSNRFTFADATPRPWHTSDIWVHGYWGAGWADSHEQVTSLNASTREVATASAPPAGYANGCRFYFENVFEEIDQPGEWYLDRGTGILYFWPPAPLDQSETIVSVLESPIVTMQSVSNVVFQDITFGYTRGHVFVIDGGSTDTIAGCKMINIGDSAVYATAGTGHTITGCDIAYTGDDSIVLQSGRTFPGRVYTGHTIHNNHIQHFSRWSATYHPAIMLEGADGNRVSHNLLHDSPHMAIGCWASNNIFEYNEVHDACKETRDSGAFYTIGRDYGYSGNIVRYNRFHDIHSPLNEVIAVYLDDGASNVTVFGNLFDNVEYGIMMGGGSNNTMNNNCFVNAHPAIHVDRRLGVDPSGDTIRRNIFYGMGDWLYNHDWYRPSYTSFNIGSNIVNPLNSNFVTENGTLVFKFGTQRIPASVIGLMVDPLFMNAANGDYRLRDDSPAFGQGFEAIPIDQIGLVNDEYRSDVSGNHPPTLGAVSDQNLTVGETLALKLTAADADNDALTYGVSGLPEGATFDPATGTLAWQPAASQTGVYTVTLTANDGQSIDLKTITVSIVGTDPAVPNDYIARWKFDGNANDETGTYNGTPSGGVSFVKGIEGQSALLDGTSSLISLPISLSAATDPTIRPVTISAWWQPSGIEHANENEAFLSGSWYHWMFTAPGNIPTAQIFNSAATLYSVSSNTEIPAGKWAHVAAVYDTDHTIRLYVNGELKNTGTWDGSFTRADSAMTIGSRADEHLTGQLDEMIVYNRALSDQEIANIYALQNPSAGNSAPVLAELGPQVISEGTLLNFELSATDADGDHIAFTAENLPPGAEFNSATGAFSWRPDYQQAGDYTATFTVSDGFAQDAQQVAFTVADAGDTAPVTASAHPNMYIDAGEIAGLKAKVQAGLQPWKAAYDQMMANANNALNQPLKAVTYNGGGHYFRTDNPYLSDGVYDPNANREDYAMAIAVSRAVRDLGLAYQFSGEAQYAKKALELIYEWCLNPDTYMEPLAWNFGPATPGHTANGAIELFITLPGMIYGADLIWDYNGWTPENRTAFLDWTRRLGIDARDRTTYGNNFEDWRLVLIATAGALTEDQSLLDYTVSRFQQVVGFQMDAQGRMTQELSRTNSLSYSLYGLNALVQVAEIARHHGADLYNYTIDGKGLKPALDFHDGYVVNPGAWPYQQNEPLTATENVALFEPAYSFFRQQSYLDAINHWGRPMTESRVMGPVTLTHGNLFDVDTSVNSGPVLEAIGNQEVKVGATLAFQVQATDPDGQVTLLAEGLPAGATFDPATGQFSFTPAAEGSHSVTFTASDGTTAVAETIVITAVPAVQKIRLNKYPL